MRVKWLDAMEIEEAAEGGNLHGDIGRRDRKLSPICRAVSDCPDIAFLIAEIDDDQRFVVSEQRLDIVDIQRPRIRSAA